MEINSGDTNLYGYTIGDPVNSNDPTGLWSVSIGAYAGVGAQVTFGVGSQTGQGFMNVQFGFGVGWNPAGDRSGSDNYNQCQSSGFGVGLFSDANFSARPVSASLGNELGRDFPNNADSQLYANILTPNASIGSGFGINASAAFGGQFTMYTSR